MAQERVPSAGWWGAWLRGQWLGPAVAHQDRPCSPVLLRPEVPLSAPSLTLAPPPVVTADDLEQWKPVPDWPYEASIDGQVRRIPWLDARGCLHIGGIVAQCSDKRKGKGYLYANLRDGHRHRRAAVHILVLEAHRSLRPGPGVEGCHDNGIRTDNRLVNLFWKTKPENRADRERHRLEQACNEVVVLAARDVTESAFPQDGASRRSSRHGVTGDGLKGTGSSVLSPIFSSCFLFRSNLAPGPSVFHSVPSVTGWLRDVRAPAPSSSLLSPVRPARAWPGTSKSRIRKHGPHALTWRWLSGEAWHGSGNKFTNRGWTRAGPHEGPHRHRVRAPPLVYWPRWQHALWRFSVDAWAALLTCAGALCYSSPGAPPPPTSASRPSPAGPAATVRGRSAVQEWSAPEELRPAPAARLAGDAGIPLANRPESWLEIPRDLSTRS